MSGGPNRKGIWKEKAKDLMIGRLLVKTENMLAKERSQLNQNIAFAATRSYTTNAEEKTIIKEWKEGGSEEYREKRAETIVQSVAEMVGMTGSEVTKLGPKPKTSKGAGVGKWRYGQKDSAEQVKNPQAQAVTGKKGGFRYCVYSPPLRKTHHRRKTPPGQKWECKGGKGGEKVRGKERKGNHLNKHRRMTDFLPRQAQNTSGSDMAQITTIGRKRKAREKGPDTNQL